mmetsp:Transcript_37522/g.89882  ORF Transcript_37522/g.89882 Transcript_37522/m.89882 type:complete len:259 (+) Transcript_37522:294-1070(+)
MLSMRSLTLMCFVFCSAVTAYPGSAQIDLTFESPTFPARAMAKQLFANLVCPYRVHGPSLPRKAWESIQAPFPPSVFGSLFSMYFPSRVLGKSLAEEEWVTSRASPRLSAAFLMEGNTSEPSRKWDSWFVCICTSNPSLVLSSSNAMIPALLQSTSSPPYALTSSFTIEAASFTLSKLMRSQSIVLITVFDPSTLYFCRPSSAFEALSDFRFRSKTRSAFFDMAARAMATPSPDVVPVIATVFPSMVGTRDSSARYEL